jgi:alcohol dehydrogenase
MASGMPLFVLAERTEAAIPDRMKAVMFDAHGGIERLHYRDCPVPGLAPDEVMVRMHAVALNGFDPMVLRGLPTLPCPLPMVPCSDGAGEIVRCGEAVDARRWPVGRRVSIMPVRPGLGVMGETLPGLAAEYRAIPQSALLALPDALSYVDGACLPTAYGTAHRMMVTRAKVARGERVLILGAAGGVGTACVQLACLAGAETIACANSPAALGKLEALGAHHVVDTSRQDVLAEVIRRFGKPSAWGGGGVDVVVNYLGGDTWGRSLACLSRGGRLVTCGASAGPEVTTDLRFVWSLEIEVIGSNGWDVDDQAKVLGLAADKRLRPVVHAVRPLSDYATALQELMDGAVIGKSVLEPTG